MTDTNTAEREAFEAHCLRTGHSSTSLGKWGEVDDVPTSMRGDYIMRNIQNAWLAFQAGRASLAANAGSEPVAHLWQHSETGRTRVVMLDAVTDADASWLLVGPLCLGTHPSPPEGMAGWEPIATAPKDGTYLLLWEQYSTHPFVGYWGFGSWSASHEHVDAEGGWDGANVVDSISQDLITHWMPLPAPPLPASEAKEL